MDYKELKEFIKSIAKSGVSEVDIRTEKMRIKIKVSPDATFPAGTHTETLIQQVPINTQYQTATQIIPQTILPTGITTGIKTVEDSTTGDSSSKYVSIKSPMVGTFYRRPSPDKSYYVNVGDTVTEKSVVCIIEAMKLFNEIEAEVTGKIVKILVEDSSPVEFGQALYLVDPS
jgi:acetyl-CoA carboxylase biotin carboxyl carrier protein